MLWTYSNCRFHFLISLEKTAFHVGISGNGEILDHKGQVCVWDNLPCQLAASRGIWGKKCENLLFWISAKFLKYMKVHNLSAFLFSPEINRAESRWIARKIIILVAILVIAIIPLPCF